MEAFRIPEISYLCQRVYQNEKKVFNSVTPQRDDNNNVKKPDDQRGVGPTGQRQLKWYEYETKIVWFNAIGFLFMHLTALYGLFVAFTLVFSLQFSTVLWMILMTFAGGEGITIGAHRLWSHRSYKARLPLKLLLIACQTIAGQNCLYIWARDHRQHHKYSDTDADPHNASRGFFFSHIGWLMMKKHPEVIKKGKAIDMSDLEACPIVMFQKKYYKPLYVLLAMFLPISVPCYFWGESIMNSILICYFTRYVILLNITWSVNSVAHIFGTRPYDKKILPVESYFVSFIGFGEGWHNYHHAFPWDYKASEFGQILNGTTRIIEFFARIGWAYDLKEASRNLMLKTLLKHGDGSHAESKIFAEVPEEELVLTESEKPNDYCLKEVESSETEQETQPKTESMEEHIYYKIPKMNEALTTRRPVNRVRHG